MKLIKNATNQKLRGGFYTPEPIADFILKWAFNGSRGQDILEPSCGDGVFLESIRNNSFPYKSITAVEIEKEEAKKSENLNLKSTEIINSDFHEFCNKTKKRFDIVVGNPPYIRYQYFDKKQQKEAANIFNKVDLKYSKLTNAWVSFVVGSSLLLKDNGKIGFVLPAELLQVSYAKTLRNYLSHYFNKINIISFKKLVFPDIQQEVVLLLCEKNDTDKHLIEHMEIEDASKLKDVDFTLLKSPKKEIDFQENKWTFYFLDQEEIDFLEKLKKLNNIPKIKDYASNEVGITTGKNDFFTVTESTVKEYKMEKYAKPLMGRSVQLKGVNFSKKDWNDNRKNGARVFLLVFPEREKLAKENKRAMEYILMGEKKGYQNGYKCRIRGEEWHIAPSLKISEAFFTRQNHLFPKMVVNTNNAYTTDTVHRVFIKKGTNVKAFVASFYNSLSLAFSEIVGRSYGGGVLELMPNEVEEILFPYKKEHAEMIEKLDAMFRKGKNIDEILEYSDEVILKKGFGFSNREVKLANNIWKKLSRRRLNRKNNKKC
ncbi:MAG: Eco57I restriction-modification methylase domain-containing protein [Chitinophagales bacterium]|jgi:adenine-specific DNA methylase|nr:Eco57I restriction-modification methylase domain-containing protein [Chitinophagales bacterium]